MEFEDAYLWHEEQEPGLGDQFEAAVHVTFNRILQDPGRFPLSGKTVRKARVEVFDSYSIYFSVEPYFIGVVAVFHGARDPEALRKRMK